MIIVTYENIFKGIKIEWERFNINLEKVRRAERIFDLLDSTKDKKKYFVKDIFDNENTRALFILESPHVKEVKYKYPLAGDSGLIFSDAIFNINIPFGLLLKEKKIAKLMNFDSANYAVINVCNIPMQEAAYSEEDIDKYRDIINSFKNIRQNSDAKSRNKELTSELEKLLIKDFKQRLIKRTFNNENIKLIVPFGKVAKNFLEKILIIDEKYKSDIKDKIFNDIPHPSNSQWYEKEEELSILKQKMKKR